jgi:hypothetical protein
MTRLHGPPIAAVLLYAVSVALAGCGDDSGGSESGAAGSTSSGGATATGGGSAQPTFPGMGGALTATTEGEFYINEVMPSNHHTIQDEGGSYPDWIEIYNAADGPASLGNYWLGDNPDPDSGELLRAQMPEHFVVPAHGAIILFADSDTVQGEHHLPFNLEAEGEWVVLTDSEGNQVDAVQWGPEVGPPDVAPDDQSLARTVDGAGEFVWCMAPTPGQPNGTACAP